MSFLKRIFGGDKDRGYVDKEGLYFFFRCDHCGSKVQVRADKQHDLNRDGDGYVWHKTIVDSECFRHIPVVVHLDSNYQVTSQEIEGGRFISEAEYKATDAADQSPEA